MEWLSTWVEWRAEYALMQSLTLLCKAGPWLVWPVVTHVMRSRR